MDRAASSANRLSSADSEAATPGPSARAGYFRWVICALLLFGITKNYMDRQVLGILKDHTATRSGMERNRLRQSGVRFPGGLRRGHGGGGPAHGPAGYPAGLRAGHGLLEPGFHGARPRQLLHQLYGRPVGVGFRRVRSFSCQHQDRRRMVSQERAGAGDGNLQRRDKYRRHHHSVWWFRGSRFNGAGAGRSSSPAPRGLSGLSFWLLLYRKPEEHPRVSKAELDYIRSDPRPRWRKSNGPASFPIVKPGRSW